MIHFGSTRPSSAAKYVRSMPSAFVARMETAYLEGDNGKEGGGKEVKVVRLDVMRMSLFLADR